MKYIFSYAVFIILGSLISYAGLSTFLISNEIRAFGTWVTMFIAFAGLYVAIKKYIIDEEKHKKESVVVSFLKREATGHTATRIRYKIFNKSSLAIFIRKISIDIKDGNSDIHINSDGATYQYENRTEIQNKSGLIPPDVNADLLLQTSINDSNFFSKNVIGFIEYKIGSLSAETHRADLEIC